MKLLYDFLPVLLFFFAYQRFGIFVATAVLVVTSAVQIGVTRWRTGHFQRMQVVTFGVVLLFGGATLVLRDPAFIKWKPTIVYWLFAAVVVGSLASRPPGVVERLLGSTFSLSPAGWVKLSWAWAAFFAATGGLNLVVAYRWSEAGWVRFKLFGLLGLTVGFVVVQAMLLRDRLVEVEAREPGRSAPLE